VNGLKSPLLLAPILGIACYNFPLATVVVLLAAKYGTVQAEAASLLLILTFSLVITAPAML